MLHGIQEESYHSEKGMVNYNLQGQPTNVPDIDDCNNCLYFSVPAGYVQEEGYGEDQP